MFVHQVFGSYDQLRMGVLFDFYVLRYSTAIDGKQLVFKHIANNKSSAAPAIPLLHVIASINMGVSFDVFPLFDAPLHAFTLAVASQLTRPRPPELSLKYPDVLGWVGRNIVFRSGFYS